jgi:MFS family permease
MESTALGVRGLSPPWYGLLLLPQGATTGFVTVMLGYVLTHNGVSVAAVAGLVSLVLLPQTWRFVMGPLLDLSLTAPRWYLLMMLALAATAAAFALAPLEPRSLPLLSVLCFLLGVTSNAAGSSAVAAMAATTPNEKRGGVSGWMAVGNLGGIGLGGGLSLWIAVHAGGPKASALVFAAACLVCSAPMLRLLPLQRATAGEGGVFGAFKGVVGALWSLIRTRTGALVALVQVLPASLGAAANLLPSVAGDWRASADLVASMTGVLGGLAALPGCVIGGYLCNHLPRRTVYVVSALACAFGEAGMALAPHTPATFALFVLGNNLLLGVSWGAVGAVAYECLGPKAAATISSVLASLSNLPVVLVTALVGVVQSRAGSNAMLLTEAGLGVASVAFYAVLATLWRPAATRPPLPEAAPA